MHQNKGVKEVSNKRIRERKKKRKKKGFYRLYLWMKCYRQNDFNIFVFNPILAFIFTLKNNLHKFFTSP